MAVAQAQGVSGAVDSTGTKIDPNMDPGWIAQLTGGGATAIVRKPRAELPPSLAPAPSLRSALFSLFGSLPVFMTGTGPVDSTGTGIDGDLDPGWVGELTGGGATGRLPRPTLLEPPTIGIPQLPPPEVTDQRFGGIPSFGFPPLARSWGNALTGLAFTGCVVGLCYLLRQPGLGQRVLAFAKV